MYISVGVAAHLKEREVAGRLNEKAAPLVTRQAEAGKAGGPQGRAPQTSRGRTHAGRGQGLGNLN